MHLKILLWICLCLLLASCVMSPQHNRYQNKPASAVTTTGAVAGLHRRALDALAQNNTRLAIDFLQRAIKIEPRNALSWHYLAQSYQQSRNFPKCLAMIERSLSYSFAGDDLDQANRALQEQCQSV